MAALSREGVDAFFTPWGPKWLDYLPVGEVPENALHQALVRAVDDPSGRAEVIGLLRGSNVLAATWPMDADLLRTLTNSDGLTALAIFSSQEQLHEAAIRYAWLAPDGSAPSKELHISEALSFARGRGANLVILDIAADHSLELDEGEVELLLSSPSRPPSRQALEPVRPTSRPPGKSAFRPRSVTPPPQAGAAVQATFGAQQNVELTELGEEPTDELLDELASCLRSYPEVEWACLLNVARGPAAAAPTVAIRITPEFRQHVAEIHTRVREAGGSQGATLDFLLLDDPELTKAARGLGVPFYPWRKKP